MNIDAEMNEEELYKQTFELACIGMTLTNEDGIFLEVNETFCNMLGYSKEQLKKLSYHDVTHPDDLPSDVMLRSKIKNYELSTYQIEKRYICKNGNIVWASINVSRVKGSQMIIAQAMDITRKKEKEELYKWQEASYHLMAKYSTDLIMRHYPDGKAFSVSPSAKEIVGYEPHELIGSSPYDQMFIHPDDIPRTIESHKQVQLKLLSKVRYRIRQKSGCYIWIESTVKGIFNKNTNQLEEIITVSRDCTDQVQYDTKLKKAKEKLEQSNDLINNIFESITDGFLALDYKGNIIFLNRKAEQISQKNKHEVIGKKVWDKFPFLKGETFEKSFLKTIKKQLPSQYEMYYEKLSVWFEIRLYPRKESVTLYFTDITQRKNNEEFLHKVDKLKVVGQLAAGVAHEIRNPLTAIKGFIQLFQTNREYNELYFDIMNTEFQRVESIIYEFLTLAKPHHENNYIEEDICKIVKEVVTLENTNAIFKNIELNLNYDEESTLIHCDKNALKQVFINIIQNAIEATNTKGKIEILIKKHNHDLIEIICQDFGCGIPKNLIHRIGEPFYSLKEKGTGLGLMICYKIIENHKGTILIDSEEGKGTIVSVRLPIRKRTALN